LSDSMNILIVGGGIGGPALATFLAQSPHFSVTLAEQAPEFKTIGYAIALWENGRRILDELGVRSAVEKHGYAMPWLSLENFTGTPLRSVFFNKTSAQDPIIILERSALHRALIERMKREKVSLRLNAKVTGCAHNKKGVEVTFADGSTEQFDLVVGADGIRSRIRELVFGSGFSHPYGWSVWSGWAPQEHFHAKGGVEIVGEGNIYLAYPLEDRAVLVFASYLPASAPDTTPDQRYALLRERFSRAKPSVRAAVESFRGSDSLFYDHLAHIDMPLWHKGRVVLIGDAQHGMSPLTGMGASMALEDAAVLAEELLKTEGKKEWIAAALLAFEYRREKRIRKFKRMAHRIEHWLLSRGLVSYLRDIFVRVLPMQYFISPLERFILGRP
jgi:2-polyprenyl-6-methoxyphenol hydroxylase-like FAD-dependent oxidoreductase